MPGLLHIPLTTLFLVASTLPAAGSATQSASQSTAEIQSEDYAWLSDDEDFPPLISLAERFPVPEGWQRVKVEESSWGAWLRGLPVRTDRNEVLSHVGDPIASAPAAAVIYMDVGERNLQQCADTAIRLHAEYHWAAGTAEDSVGYHFTSGDYLGWHEFSRGERLVVADGEVERRQNGKRRSDYQQFRNYLTRIFVYAGTRSLRLDSEKVEVDQKIKAGDVFNQGGSPGHAIIVLDVATDPEGRRHALLGQGFMPAQELHVLESSQAVEGVWFELPGPGGSLDTPSWSPFQRTDAIRFKN